LFIRRKEIIELREMNQNLVNSFSNVKNDMNQVSSWITYLYNQNNNVSDSVVSMSHNMDNFNQKFFQLNSRIDELRNFTSQSEDRILRHLKGQMKDEIRSVIDYYYNFEPLISRIRDSQSEVQSDLSSIKVRINELSSAKNLDMASQLEVLSEIKALRQRLDDIEKIKLPQKTTIREKLIKKITQKSKDYVKNLLISYIRKYEKISALKLREMIVEEQGLASKSSFYRILEELESFEELDVVKEGKEKYYFYKLIKHH